MNTVEFPNSSQERNLNNSKTVDRAGRYLSSIWRSVVTENAHMKHSVGSLEENLANKINAEAECRHAPTHLLKCMQRIKLTCKLLKCQPKQSSTFFKGKKNPDSQNHYIHYTYYLIKK